jgi:hypothetical protein
VCTYLDKDQELPVSLHEVLVELHSVGLFVTEVAIDLSDALPTRPVKLEDGRQFSYNTVTICWYT